MEREITRVNGAQALLIEETPKIQTALITQRKEFDALFLGFEKLRAVSYVISPVLLLDFLTEHKFSQIEVVVGENLARIYKETLASRELEIVEALAEKIENNSLRILIPHRTDHSKLYILEKPGMVRVINGSANLTETAQSASNQINHEWYLDLPVGHPLISKFIRDYEAHTKRCSVFMEDLFTLFRQAHDTPRSQIIEAWLTGTAVAEGSQGASRVLGELTARALEPVDTASQSVFTLNLPNAPAERRETQQALAKLGIKAVGDVIEVNRRAVFDYVEKMINVPLMVVDIERGQVRLAMNGSLQILNEEPTEPEVISRALAHIERYINTVDLGQSPDPLVAKIAMFEAILYFLAAPFANEHMKIMRQSFGVQTSRRGPKWLYLYGRTGNGKSTISDFALSLLTGCPTKALEASKFTKTRLKNAIALGTCFPLVFNDVKAAHKSGLEAVQPYWEEWWTPDRPSPQVILSSNEASLKPWMQSRVKRVDFNVHFPDIAENKMVLKDLLEEYNPLFHWFSALYLSRLAQGVRPYDDELHLARQVLQDLYIRSGRDIPPFFPDRPLESIFDPDLALWKELYERQKQAKFNLEHGRLIVEFRDDLQRSDLTHYDAALPQIVKWDRRGRTMTIDNPEEFFGWLGTKPSTWLGRLGRIFIRRRP